MCTLLHIKVYSKLLSLVCYKQKIHSIVISVFNGKLLIDFDLEYFLLFKYMSSEVRECLKLDQDHKRCFVHYKQVKKLNKLIESAEALIRDGR